MGTHICIAPGSINIDLILKTNALKGLKTFKGHYSETQGGKGANEAVAIRLASNEARDVYLVGCVGRDNWGQQALEKLKAKGVNTDFIKIIDSCRTGVVVEYLYGDGQVDNNAERFEVYRDLQLAGLISGDYNGTSDLPNHAFGDDMDMVWVDPGPGEAKHYFRFFNLPAEVCLEIDMKNDDGDRTSGSILASEDYTPGNTVGTFYMLF